MSCHLEKRQQHLMLFIELKTNYKTLFKQSESILRWSNELQTDRPCRPKIQAENLNK